MKLSTTVFGLLAVIGLPAIANAQFPTASKEHKILKMEEGKWDAEVTMFMGPAGPYEPPQKSKGMEVNRMIGEFWLVSDFTGSFEGLKFVGQGQFGYDAKTKKFVGTWIDSFSPNPTKMVGTYDAEKKTLAYETTGVGMDGSVAKGTNVVVYSKDKRIMTMHVAAPGTDQMIKVMEIIYTRAK